MTGGQRMNVFTTDHPMVSQPPCFDTRRHPALSFVWSSLILALMFTPLVILFYVAGVCSDAYEIGAEYDFPDSWPWFIAEVFALCFFVASALVSAYRLLEWHFRNKFLGR